MANHPPSSLLPLLLLTTLLLASAGLTLGLTFAPCHSSLCVELLHPYQTRIHIAVFYSLLASLTLALTARVYLPALRRLSGTYISDRPLPLVGKRLTVGGVVLVLWIAAATFASIAYWLPAQYSYWYARGALVDWTPKALSRVAWTGITGHWCDIWVGLVILPVGRNSIIGRAFGVHTSVLLFAHKVLAYTFFVGALVHGVTYYAFVAAYASAPASAQSAFVVDNPTVSVAEQALESPYSNLVLPTGVFSFVLILVVTITALPALRRSSYNTFYFIHVVFAALILILTSIHASTNFYFLLPGLLLWLADWVWRLRHSLSTKEEAIVENASNGWTRVRLPSEHALSANDGEKGANALSTLSTPVLATYYVNFPSISKLQVHPFTAASTGSAGTGPVLLFRRGPERKKAKKTAKEFTWAVAATAADKTSAGTPSTLKVRVEGPYTSSIPEASHADHLLLLAGGTGITGALDIANWWAAKFGSVVDHSKSLRLVWSIREEEVERVQEVQDLQITMAVFRNMEFVVHASGKLGRLDPEKQLATFLASRVGTGGGGGAWVYVSGPEGLLADAETACVRKAKEMRRGSAGDSAGTMMGKLDWYIARWSL
ncbi:hypothetical protein LTR12_004761 [Friedmanniomyces endolithicus]|nr:hypothetical protein LTR12_004761 [Friedmanniomyces endolithicus]